MKFVLHTVMTASVDKLLQYFYAQKYCSLLCYQVVLLAKLTETESAEEEEQFQTIKCKD